MKGLLIKDWYIAIKSCKMLLIFSLAFVVLGATTGANAIFPFYPMIVCGTLPVSLYSFDEKNRWNAYCDGLPVSRRQIVTAKYLELLAVEAGILALTLPAQGLRLAITGESSIHLLMRTASLWLAAGLFSPAVMLPIILRFGSEKGRIAYYIIIFSMVAALLALGGELPGATGLSELINPGVSITTLLAALALTALSWALSVKLYEGKEGA